VNKELKNFNTINPGFDYTDELVNNVVNTFDLNEEHLILQQNIYNDNFTNN
jgi:hypothetical protein